jgi:cell division protein ZapE
MMYVMKIEYLYKQKVDNALLKEDEAQLAVISDLQEVKNFLENNLAEWQPFGRMFKWTLQEPQYIQGLYFYGSVGRGKSMLMDMFFESVEIQHKRRVHFHEFMGEVHERMHHGTFEKGIDPVHQMAMDIAKEARLLCFDEFYISNIADAMMLGRLFEMLMKTGVIMCTTSNWSPENLFQGGHNRVLFKPFIKLIEKSLNIVSLGDGQDWRVADNPSLELYLVGEMGEDNLKNLWRNNQSTSLSEVVSVSLEDGTFEGVTSNNTVFTTFKQLCGQAFASEQYLQISSKFKHVFVQNIPVFDIHMQDEAMRFVVMVDIFYEKGTTFICSADALPEDLCPEGESAFAFQRTASRLMEMQKRSVF